MMFMQKSYIVHGRPGIEAQLKIALVNARGPFTGPIQWRMSGEGKSRKCTAFAVHRDTGETCEYTIDWATVEAQEWNKPGKNGFPSRWTTMPDKMFRYRSASWLIDLYCPEVTLGLATVDELLEADEARTIDVTPGGASAKVIEFPGSRQEHSNDEVADWAGLYRALPVELEPGDQELLKEFVEATAKANQTTVDNVIVNATDQVESFYEAFTHWEKARADKRGQRQAGTSTPNEHDKGTDSGSSAGNDQTESGEVGEDPAMSTRRQHERIQELATEAGHDKDWLNDQLRKRTETGKAYFKDLTEEAAKRFIIDLETEVLEADAQRGRQQATRQPPTTDMLANIAQVCLRLGLVIEDECEDRFGSGTRVTDISADQARMWLAELESVENGADQGGGENEPPPAGPNGEPVNDLPWPREFLEYCVNITEDGHLKMMQMAKRAAVCDEESMHSYIQAIKSSEQQRRAFEDMLRQEQL